MHRLFSDKLKFDDICTTQSRNGHAPKLFIAMTTEKPLIVILGLGEMGLIHARNLSKERRVLLGLASRRKDVLEKTAEELAADRTFSSFDEVFQDPQVKGVVISTPPPTHPEVIKQAAKAGKHIFSEKPLGYDSTAIADALQAVEKAGVRFTVGFNRRWDSEYIAARRAVENGTLGDPVVLKCTSGDPEYPEKYHRGAAKHALLKDLAVHDIDLARWLTRSEVKRVYVICDALSYPSLKENDDADVAVAILEMASGAKVVVHLSRAFHFGYNVTTELFCKEGAMQIGQLESNAVVTVKDRRTARGVHWDFGDRFHASFTCEMSAFAELVLAKTNEDASTLLSRDTSYAGGRDGLAATVVAETLVKSYLSGMPETVPGI